MFVIGYQKISFWSCNKQQTSSKLGKEMPTDSRVIYCWCLTLQYINDSICVAIHHFIFLYYNFGWKIEISMEKNRWMLSNIDRYMTWCKMKIFAGRGCKRSHTKLYWSNNHKNKSFVAYFFNIDAQKSCVRS